MISCPLSIWLSHDGTVWVAQQLWDGFEAAGPVLNIGVLCGVSFYFVQPSQYFLMKSKVKLVNETVF